MQEVIDNNAVASPEDDNNQYVLEIIHKLIALHDQKKITGLFVVVDGPGHRESMSTSFSDVYSMAGFVHQRIHDLVAFEEGGGFDGEADDEDEEKV